MTRDVGAIESGNRPEDIPAETGERIRAGETAIRVVIDTDAGGRIVTLGVPGLRVAHDGKSWLSPDDIAETVHDLSALRVRLLVFLLEPEECPRDARRMVRLACAENGIRFLALPIADFAAPSPAWERAWRKIAPCVNGIFGKGEAIAACCLYGAGRSGTVAAMILQERGMKTDDALATIRRGFPDSVESPIQEAWLRGHARRLHSDTEGST